MKKQLLDVNTFCRRTGVTKNTIYVAKSLGNYKKAQSKFFKVIVIDEKNSKKYFLDFEQYLSNINRPIEISNLYIEIDELFEAQFEAQNSERKYEQYAKPSLRGYLADLLFNKYKLFNSYIAAYSYAQNNGWQRTEVIDALIEIKDELKKEIEIRS